MSQDKLPGVDYTDELRSGKRLRPFRTRSLFLIIALAVVWFGVLLDPQIGRLALAVVGAFGMTLAVMAAAMGLGLLGFGIFTISDRLAGWVRRATQWPDE